MRISDWSSDECSSDLTLLFAIGLLSLASPVFGEDMAPKRYTIEQLMDSDSIGGLSWSPDDRKLIFTSNRTGIANIYVMPSGGGDAVPLTHSTKETVRAIGSFPEDESILFSIGRESGRERVCQ